MSEEWSGNPEEKDRQADRTRQLIAAALVVATLLLYFPVGGHTFILLDDDAYVTNNPVVRSGLTAESAAWAFRTGDVGNWHPVTWLSHMLDVSLFGLDAGWHLRENMLLHAINAALLFLLLCRMTGRMWPSAVVAALFAVHPLHVESVAWVSERKDLLCALFWLLSIRAYVERVKSGGRAWLPVSLAFFALAFMSKPMAVTLPVVLLLLDYWPLGRFGGGENPGDEGGWRRAGRLLAEKAPFVVLSLLFCAVTVYVQDQSRFVGSFELFPLGDRISNALVSYVAYLSKTAWPASLSVFYPHPSYSRQAAATLWKAGASLAALGAATAACLHQRRARPYLVVGWLWSLVMLLPVIGLVQVGGQAMADRYTYLPLIGIFAMAAWAGAEWLSGRPSRRMAAGAAAAALLAALAVGTRVQLSHWTDTPTLFGHALEVTRDNWLIHHNMGTFLEGQRRYEEAAGHYREAMRIAPRFIEPRFALAYLMADRGNLVEATRLYEEVLRIQPDDEMAHNNLGNILFSQGKLEEAAAHFREAMRISPIYEIPRFNLGNVLRQQGRTGEAIAMYREALRINPGYAKAQAQLDLLLSGR
jgi:tetratricopeptide (TPR) repeat protein